MRARKVLINLTVFVVFLIIGLIGIELIYRSMIFGENDSFENFRDPWAYADMDSEELFWILYHKWDGTYKPPECPHPLLGWIGDFSRHSLMHWSMDEYSGKRPVLLYGNSFAMCSPLSICFQTILNNDSVFSKEHYLFNYGVGGYGVDQISLLFDQTYRYFEKPFVIFGLLTYDLDRSILQFRTGQKPYYEVEGDSLVLKGIPVNPNPDQYLEDHPPRAFSYLWRKFLYSKENFLPQKTINKLKGTGSYNRKKIEVNEKILLKVVNELRENDIEFVFVIFHTLHFDKDNFAAEEEYDWRNMFLKEFLEDHQITHIWTKDIVVEDTTCDKYQTEKYILNEDGHPTTYFNSLIARRMKELVLSNPMQQNEREQLDQKRRKQIITGELYPEVDVSPTNKDFFDYQLDYYKDYVFLHERNILNDPGLLSQLKLNSDTTGIPIENIIKSYAIWKIIEKEEECFMK